VLAEILSRVKPTPEERLKVGKVISRLFKTFKELKGLIPVNFKVEIEGSIAKDTWISGDKDIDVFILFPRSISVEELRAYGLRIAKACADRVGGEYRERYAEHPYLEVFIRGYRVDIVPAFMIRSPEEMISAVDRTPLHTKYVRSKLRAKMRDEVRLLKQFMKGIGVYGAERRVSGFSGYLAELLVIYYGSFIDVLRGVSSWRPHKTFIDIEGHYPPHLTEVVKEGFGRPPLVLIDPVDKRRNAAASVSLEKMATFIAASRFFLRKPSVRYFYPPKPSDINLREELKKRGTYLLAVKLPCPKLPPDVLWGEIYRSLEGFRNLFKTHSFEVLSYGAWSDEEERIVFLFELSSGRLPYLERHVGPPVGSSNEEDFVSKYLRGAYVLAGPFIEGNRWVVYKLRAFTRAKELLLKRAGKVRHGKHIAKLLDSMEIYEGEELNVLLNSFGESFKEYLISWLTKRLYWLEG